MGENIKTRFVNWAVYGGLTKEEYLDVADLIKRKNGETLRMSSLMCAVMFLGLTMGALVSPIIAEARIYYSTMLAICALITVLSYTAVKKRTGLILPVWFMLLFAFGGYAVLMNTLIRPDLSAVTLCVFLVAGPLLIIDRPYRVVGFQLALAVVYLLCAHQTKTPYLAFADGVNIACCILLGSVVYMRLNRVKMREAKNTQILEMERDTDKLTGLLNKSAMEKRISDLLADGRQGALVVMDIDDFKHINDTYGHAFGDIVLQHTAECIRKTVPPESLCGRFGGDEYVLFLPDVSDGELEILLNTLMQQLRMEIVSPDPTDLFGVSLGAVMCPAPGKGYRELFQCADKALYEAKTAGKNCWRIG